MARVALLGAGGFLGSHAARALTAAGHDVIAVRRDVPLAEQLRAAAPGVVVNCAGRTTGSRAELVAANVELVVELLDALAGGGGRLVQVGSSAEYGPGAPGVPVSEDHPCRPVSAYGETKLAATEATLAATRSGRAVATVLRVFNPVGAGMAAESLPGRAALLIRGALRDGGAVELGPLDATRDFVDARDVAQAVAAACVAPGVGGSVVNVGSGRGATARELVALLAAAAGYRGPIRERSTGSPRSEAVPWQVADIRRAAAILGWRPRRSLADAVAELWSGVA